LRRVNPYGNEIRLFRLDTTVAGVDESCPRLDGVIFFAFNRLPRAGVAASPSPGLGMFSVILSH
jgi:hypothetical protein